MKKVFVIGLDCAAPSILFDRREELPNINRLIGNSLWARLRTCDPAITIPAWMAMATSKTAGELGVYGFRRRKGNSYKGIELTFSNDIREPAIWDIISKKGMQSCLVGIPPSYPPKKIDGNMVSCFMAPDADRDYTYPQELKSELESKFGRYIFDVKFRTDDRDSLIKRLYEMTKQHFEVISYLLQNKPWRFFMFVEMGPDRISHSFWKFHDKMHLLYTPGNKYENVIIDYYRFLDENIGRLLGLLDDDTAVFLVSDHGAKAMKGAFCINQWLIEKGYIALKEKPQPGTDLEEADIDWARTKVWAWGGYYARVFLNLRGREISGVIPRFRYEAWRSRLKKEITEIRGPNGERWDTQVFRSEELFPNPQGEITDLIAYFDNLNWRPAGTIGYNSIYLPENDKGPDDAVHDWAGVFIMYDPKNKRAGDLGTVSIFDFAPTVLDILGVEIPKDMNGKSLLR